jgi:ferredoxin
MMPEYVRGSVDFLKSAGAQGVAAGDTTVAYTGRRGAKENPPGDASRYLELAARHGWSADGAAGVPFVVLDRPSTEIEGAFPISAAERRTRVSGVNRFGDFYLAGGFAEAAFTVNHAHLTLHGLAGVAGAIKSIAMGCSSLAGKLRMHKSLTPEFDAVLCAACGRCVENCPQDALSLAEGDEVPVVDPERCIGCGECEAICALGKGAVTLAAREITDWSRGRDTLPFRMADYVVGLMNGKWDRTLHVLHMYSITSRCDCLDARQKPMLGRDLGFLVGRNPFALDAAAARLVAEEAAAEGIEVKGALLDAAAGAAAYVAEAYGIAAETPIERIASA